MSIGVKIHGGNDDFANSLFLSHTNLTIAMFSKEIVQGKLIVIMRLAESCFEIKSCNLQLIIIHFLRLP